MAELVVSGSKKPALIEDLWEPTLTQLKWRMRDGYPVTRIRVMSGLTEYGKHRETYAIDWRLDHLIYGITPHTHYKIHHPGNDKLENRCTVKLPMKKSVHKGFTCPWLGVTLEPCVGSQVAKVKYVVRWVPQSWHDTNTQVYKEFLVTNDAMRVAEEAAMYYDKIELDNAIIGHTPKTNFYYNVDGNRINLVY